MADQKQCIWTVWALMPDFQAGDGQTRWLYQGDFDNRYSAQDKVTQLDGYPRVVLISETVENYYENSDDCRAMALSTSSLLRMFTSEARAEL